MDSQSFTETRDSLHLILILIEDHLPQLTEKWSLTYKYFLTILDKFQPLSNVSSCSEGGVGGESKYMVYLCDRLCVCVCVSVFTMYKYYCTEL